MSRRLSETINVGVCQAYFYPEGKDLVVWLGLTKEGAQVNYEAEWHEITADQTGNMPLDDVNIGEKVTVEVSILDTTLDKIRTVFPMATGEEKNGELVAVTFGSEPGKRACEGAGKLVLHPISKGSDVSSDVIIHRTANTGNLSLGFKLDEEWKIAAVFKGYYDDTKPSGDRLMRIGAEGDYSGQETRNIVRFWVTPSNPSASVGTSVPFSASALFDTGETEDVTEKCTWVSSAPEVATIASPTTTAKATGVTSGITIIQAKFIGYTSATTLTVTN